MEGKCVSGLLHGRAQVEIEAYDMVSQETAHADVDFGTETGLTSASRGSEARSVPWVCGRRMSLLLWRKLLSLRKLLK